MKTERVQKNKRKERIILRCERKGREETKRKNEETIASILIYFMI